MRQVEVAIGLAGLGWAGPKFARFFRAKILTAQPALKTEPIGPNSLFKAKKNSGGRSGRAIPGRAKFGPVFFRANNLMAQPGPNFGRTGLTHRIRPILPPLASSGPWCPFSPSNHKCTDPCDFGLHYSSLPIHFP